MDRAARDRKHALQRTWRGVGIAIAGMILFAKLREAAFGASG
jgi:hypothetical protein